MSKVTGGNARARAYYANLFLSRPALTLSESLNEWLSDTRVQAAATGILPKVDVAFCRGVREIAAFLHNAWDEKPPSAKKLRGDLKKVGAAVSRCRYVLALLPAYSRASLGELVGIEDDFAASEGANHLGGAFPPPLESAGGAFAEVAPRTQSPSWELQDSVGLLMAGLEAFQDNVELILAEKSSGGRALSPKAIAVELLYDLVVRYGAKPRDLNRLATAYLDPVAIEHRDVSGLRDHVQRVLKENRRKRKTA